MGGKKVLFLFLGLGMPIVVLLFLKMFGRNEFAVPMPSLNVPADCRVTDTVDYQIPDSVVKKIYSNTFNLLVVNFGEASKKLNRVVEGFGVEVVKVEGTSDQQIQSIKRCGLFVQAPNSLVLIDNERRIRGFYDGSDRDELDRLDAELKIILKQY